VTNLGLHPKFVIFLGVGNDAGLGGCKTAVAQIEALFEV
jgi:hypothetical protein